MFLIVTLIIGLLFFIILMKSFKFNCKVCDKEDFEYFSKIENCEIVDYAKCKNCGEIHFLNAETYNKEY